MPAVFSGYQFGGSFHCLNFGKIRDTAPSTAFLDTSVLKTTNNLLEVTCVADGERSYEQCQRFRKGAKKLLGERRGDALEFSCVFQ